MGLVGDLRVIGERTGLVALGVCAAAAFTDVEQSIRARNESGMAAGLKFTFREPGVSTDVAASFPWAERLVVGAWSYAAAAGDPGPAAPGTGRVARFATEDHYRGLRAALGAIADHLVEMGYRAEVLVDDNRLVDRGAAVRAGVAWWGKNTMALAPGHGPWLLLGSVVTDAQLPVSGEMQRDCGTCSACLPSCPTGALVAPGVLDARRCLAAWAQAPGTIPLEFRRPMGDRLYGCDDCLDACPPGHRLLAASIETRKGRVDLIEVLGTSDRSLLRRFDHFYVPRRHARYLRRNALVALGNSGGASAELVLAGYLGHPDKLLRVHAAWALGVRGGSTARAALEASLIAERDDDVLDEMKAALSGTLR